MTINVNDRAGPEPGLEGLDDALERIAAGAAGRDGAPGVGRFPDDAFMLLRDAGALRWNALAGEVRPAAAIELGLVRRVARADGSVGRLFDGHLNAVERIAVQAPAELCHRELAAVIGGQLWAGVWGGDPVPGEGPPATVRMASGGEVLRGVKTFCSGASGLHRALVLARPAPDGGPPLSVWVDLTDDRRVEIDTSWYRSRGLVASVSHRVVFHDAPVLARLGEPGAISQQPWFARDALRTAASWGGMADAAVDGALAAIAERPGRGDLEGLAAGRILTAQRTIDVWLQAGGAAMDRPGHDADLAALALHGRAAIADACRTLLDEAARACGSRPFARGAALDRARRDLEVFLLQHRLDPMLARAGAAALEGARP
ncbi:MAG TPA: acyl-CoA dehydrogenase family protein [Solirubrobacteraceae bacterium]